MHTSSRIHFGRFEVRPAQRRLLRDGQVCRIGGRAFDVLMVLLELSHRVVTRSELSERVWRGLAVEPNNLDVQIWALRRLLGRDVILTVPRRGYRFVMPPPLPFAPRRADLAKPPLPGVTVDHGGQTQRSRLRWRSRDD